MIFQFKPEIWIPREDPLQLESAPKLRVGKGVELQLALIFDLDHRVKTALKRRLFTENPKFLCTNRRKFCGKSIAPRFLVEHHCRKEPQEVQVVRQYTNFP